jgi:hypothetical protein
MAQICAIAIAFSSEVDTGSPEENASQQKSTPSVLIQLQCRLFDVPAPQAANSAQERQIEKRH